jgi:hypothetical protein
MSKPTPALRIRELNAELEAQEARADALIERIDRLVPEVLRLTAENRRLTEALQTARVEKALKLLEALGAQCDESKGDHKWRECNHCITVNWLAFGGDDAPRKMLRDVAAALRTAGEEEKR